MLRNTSGRSASGASAPAGSSTVRMSAQSIEEVGFLHAPAVNEAEDAVVHLVSPESLVLTLCQAAELPIDRVLRLVTLYCSPDRLPHGACIEPRGYRPVRPRGCFPLFSIHPRDECLERRLVVAPAFLVVSHVIQLRHEVRCVRGCH